MAISRQGYHIEKNLAYGPDPRQKLDLYVPDELPAKAPVLLFFYRGSWQDGSKNMYLAFGQAFGQHRGIVRACRQQHGRAGTV